MRSSSFRGSSSGLLSCARLLRRPLRYYSYRCEHVYAHTLWIVTVRCPSAVFYVGGSVIGQDGRRIVTVFGVTGLFRVSLAIAASTPQIRVVSITVIFSTTASTGRVSVNAAASPPISSRVIRR